MEEPNNIEKLFSDTKDYLDTRVELAKLQAVEKASELVSSSVVMILLFILFATVFLFGSIALGFYLSEKTGSNSIGFLCVAGIYLFFAIIIYISKESLIKKPVSDMIINKMLNKDE